MAGNLGSVFKGLVGKVLRGPEGPADPVVQRQLREFGRARDEEKASYWESFFNADELAARLEAAGLAVEETEIDRGNFEEWLTEFRELASYYENMNDVRAEKLLEHYLTLKHLDLKAEDRFVDVAACGSPLSDILRKKGIAAWNQDLIYPAGVHGYQIGGNAAHMPVHDGFADILALHCAFECFWGDADTGFAVEAPRVLKKGGRVGILPLYLDTIHFVKTSPHCNKTAIPVEKEAKWLWRDDKYREPFSRHYSPESFAERIVSKMKGMDLKILRFTNLEELLNIYPGQRIYCHFMFKGIKR